MSVTPRESSGSTLQRIDDTSSRLEYSSGWNANAIPSDQATIHTSTTPGSTVTFTFNGTFVAVYGAIVSEPVTATFTLDNTAPVSQAQTQPPDAPQYNWVFFSTTPPLDPGVHSLTVEVTAGTFNLDYIEFTSIGGSDDGAQDGSPASLGTSVSSSPSAVLSTASASSSALPFSNARLSNGVIAGLVVVGVLIVCALLGTILFFHHRRTRRVRHLRQSREKPLDIIPAGEPEVPPPAARNPFRRLSRIYRPTPPISTQSSKTASSSVTQSSAMFTSVIMLSPALSVVTEEPDALNHV